MQRGAHASWLILAQSHALGKKEVPHEHAAPDALAHSPQRSLRDSGAGTQDITTVATPQAFQRAIASSVAHIDIIDHLDLNDLPVQQVNAAGDKSIRGNCTAPVPFEGSLLGPALRRTGTQCAVIAGAGGFVSISGSGGLWLDNVAVRQGPGPAGAADAPALALLSVEEGSKLWLTSSVVQGNGPGSVTGVVARSQILAQDTTFADLGGNASVARIDGAAASFVNTAFADCAASPPHALITARGGRAAVWLQDVRFPNSSDAAALRSEGDAAFYAAGALPEGAELFDAAAGAQAPPDIVAEQPAGIAFATEAEINPLREKLMVDDAAPAAPSSGGTDSINIPAVVGAVVAAVVVLVVAVLLTTRRRRGHNFQRDAWGLPINPVGPARERQMSTDTLPGRANSGMSAGGTILRPGSKAGSQYTASAFGASVPSEGGLTVSASAREVTTETSSSHALGGTGPSTGLPGPPLAAFAIAADGSVNALMPHGSEGQPIQNPGAGSVGMAGFPAGVGSQLGGASGNTGGMATASYGSSSISLGPGASPGLQPGGGMVPPGYVGRMHPGVSGGAHPPLPGVAYTPVRPLSPQGSGPPQVGSEMYAVADVPSAVATYAQAGWGFGAAATQPVSVALAQTGRGWSGPHMSQPLASESVATAAAMAPGSTASLAGVRWGTMGTTDPSRTLEPTTMGTTGALLPPGIGASAEDVMNFVEMQLDSIGEEPALGGFIMLGPQERRRGGQAVIQFARRQRLREEVAFKFFIARADYEAEVALYRNAVLGDFLPMAEAYVDNADHSFRDAYGNPFPPCIVMERGDTLHDRMRIALTDKAGTAQVLVNIAKRLSSLHQAGWVHRDLKPGNVLWLSRKQRWTLIDFGLAARIGADVSASFTPMYAAPEVVHEYKQGSGRVIAQPSQDAWALGVMAFELLTGKPAFDKFEGHASVYAQLLGAADLPWEGDRLSLTVQRQLGVFRRPVLQLLAREPTARITLHQFARDCDSVFDSPSLIDPAAAAAATSAAASSSAEQ